jgi:hypothetical protein
MTGPFRTSWNQIGHEDTKAQRNPESFSSCAPDNFIDLLRVLAPSRQNILAPFE